MKELESANRIIRIYLFKVPGGRQVYALVPQMWNRI